LQEREVEPLGSNAVSRVDVRVIAASSVDLATLVADGRFRSDLYYRLNVLPIRLPPLRERPEDLEALCEHLLEQLALEHEMLPKEIDRDALEALAAMPWPGNVRELRNVLERACSLWDGMRLTLEAFREVVPEIDAVAVRAETTEVPAEAAQPGDVASIVVPDSTASTLPERVAAVERAAIREALRATGGNRVQAARRLGIARATLYQKLAEFPELRGPP
jgi:DNA-binding NtrC family response regulator